MPHKKCPVFKPLQGRDLILKVGGVEVVNEETKFGSCDGQIVPVVGLKGEPMAEASTTEVFNCSVEDFYKIVSDYEKYPEFLSEVKNCKVIKEEGSKKLVEYTVSVMKEFKYRLWMDESPPNSIVWELDSGDLFKVSKGSWKLEDEAGKTRANYSVEAKFNMFVPGPIAKALVSVNLPNMVSSYHKRVKELYG